MWKVDPSKSTYLWDNNGVLQLKLRKAEGNQVKYWKRLEKVPSGRPMSVWWDMKDEHVDAVEDLAVDERKKGLHSDDL